MEGVPQYLFEMAFAPVDEVASWLTRLKMEVISRDARDGEEEVLFVHNPNFNMVTALVSSSPPPVRVISLQIILFGRFWPYMYPDVLPAVTKEWGRRRKEEAAKGKVRGDIHNER